MSSDREKRSSRVETILGRYMIAVEYAIVAGLMLVASVVLVRTLIRLFDHWAQFDNAAVSAINGILVVIILIDIAHTIYGHVRTTVFPVRPFLVIGILAGVRDILSASARLTFGNTISPTAFDDALISLGVGVGVVVFLLLGLLILRFSHYTENDDENDV